MSVHNLNNSGFNQSNYNSSFSNPNVVNSNNHLQSNFAPVTPALQKPSFTKAPIVGADPMNWVNKENSSHCNLCASHFSFTNRKHNCRVCGNVFCANCTKNKLNIQNAGLEKACFLCFTQHSTLTPEEQRIADEACQESNEFSQMRTLVFRKKEGKQTRQQAIIVVTRYRILRLKRNSSRILSSFSLLDLAKLTMGKKNMLILEFGKQTGASVIEQYETSKAPELALTIRIQHAQISLGMPSHCQLSIISPDEWLLPLPALQPIGVAGGFCDTYRAWCNFYSSPPSEEFIQYITDSTERTPYILDLSLCPGIEPGTNISFDLQPVFAALKYNNYFLGLFYCDASAKGAMELLSNCLRYNRTITKLQLANLNTSYITNVGHSLSENRSNVIQDFDFSGTQISEKAIKSIALSIACKEYGIRELKFSNCGLTGKGIGTLIREGLLANIDVTYSIETLDISNNKLDEEGSILLQLWLTKVLPKTTLRTLNISKSNAILNVIVPAIEQLPLEYIDFSGNTLDTETCQILSNIVINTATLKSLNVSSCSMGVSNVALLLAVTSSSAKLSEVKLNFSNNNLDEPTSLVLTNSLLRPFPQLHTLDISSTKLSEKSLIGLFETLSAYASNLHTLILNDVFGSISGHITGTRIAHLIADLTLLCPGLRKLSLADNSNASFFGSGPSHIYYAFVQRMHRNQTLLSLNLTGNKMGDKLAVAVAEMLRFNTSLVELLLDDNKTTLSGFQAIEYSLQRNRTLQRFEYPLSDIKRCLQQLPNEVKEKKLFSILNNIQLSVYYNRHNAGANPILEEAPIVVPRAGPILLFEGQNLPGDGPALLQNPLPGSEHPVAANYASNYYENNAYNSVVPGNNADDWPVNNNAQQNNWSESHNYNDASQSWQAPPLPRPPTNTGSDLYQTLSTVL